MPSYTVELTDEQVALFSAYNNPENWIRTVMTHRANEAMKELFKVEIEKAKLKGVTIPANIEQAVLNSDEESMKARTEAYEEKMNVPDHIDPLTGLPWGEIPPDPGS